MSTLMAVFMEIVVCSVTSAKSSGSPFQEEKVILK